MKEHLNQTDQAAKPLALIVEDDPSISSMLSEYADRHGYGGDVARDCKETLEKVSANTFDLILLDINLPDGSGLDIIVKLLEKNPGTKIVVMTGDNSRELETKARDFRIYYYLVKPFSSKELHAVFADAFKKPSAEVTLTLSP